MPNQLIHESSPYLLQHKDNPVDWHAWGSKAIEKARREDKPIFLSIGYSACHWCHVMEHESFENDEIAAVLNEHFVSIKVDREERPDLDQIYMNVVQMLTGHGGWPMSVFLTPELKPFYGGTYWPPQSSRGMPGFDQVLHAVIDAWQNRRPQATETAEQITAELNKLGHADGESVPQPSTDWIAAAVTQLRSSYDPNYGGFGQSPKFPHPMDLALLLRVWHRDRQANALEMVRYTLDRMAAGGIYDQLGGGFARYSVDARWLVPHFEKMLYDNALLAGVYLDAYLATGEATYGRVVRETLDYTLRDMTDPAGGFYSTEDADSEGEEGLFYTWTPEEIAAVLGPERVQTFCRVFDVNDVGNFEGRCILNLPKTIAQSAAILGREPDDLVKELATSKQKLFAAREKRVRPGRDDKVIVAWNGLMIDVMARAGAALGEPRYVEAARRAADFILTQLVDRDGRLLHTWRHGAAKLAAYLDDYTCLANSLVSLYEATFEERWIDEAVRLIETVREKFADPAGGFFYTASDHEQLIARNKEWTDSSTPSGNGMAANVLVRLGRLLGRRDFVDAALTTIGLAHNLVRQAPTAVGQLLLALDQTIDPSYELALVGSFDHKETGQAIEAIHRRFLPNCVVAARDSKNGNRSAHLDAIFQGKESPGGQPTLFVCREFACEESAVGLEAIKTRLDGLASL